ncbi:MAG: ThuA domain-containing protein [Lachnospiraceae bacterium]|jgi:type 1 glutamine amidotransferase|nr:ThuA domain-containing protein [Lachnospiraceae bacterium]
MKKALVFWGGWDGHEPQLTSKRFASYLREEGFAVELSDKLDVFADLEMLMDLDMIVACWTMGEIEHDYVVNISKAVGSGVGLAGCHGGMCDSFRNNTEWQFITGGQWISHPGGDGVEYMVNICHGSSPITIGIDDFMVKSEHYYLHIDPAIEVLATTLFPHPDVPYYHVSNKPVAMPVAWTKYWGNGRVYYTSLGHHDDVFEGAEAALLMKRGMLWAAEGKEYAIKNALTTARFESEAKMY